MGFVGDHQHRHGRMLRLVRERAGIRDDDAARMRSPRRLLAQIKTENKPFERRIQVRRGRVICTCVLRSVTMASSGDSLRYTQCPESSVTLPHL